MAKNEKKKSSNIVCDICGYGNHADKIKIYGTCRGCGKILDGKAKFRYDMNKKLRLWRGKLK